MGWRSEYHSNRKTIFSWIDLFFFVQHNYEFYWILVLEDTVVTGWSRSFSWWLWPMKAIPFWWCWLVVAMSALIQWHQGRTEGGCDLSRLCSLLWKSTFHLVWATVYQRKQSASFYNQQDFWLGKLTFLLNNTVYLARGISLSLVNKSAMCFAKNRPQISLCNLC